MDAAIVDQLHSVVDLRDFKYAGIGRWYNMILLYTHFSEILRACCKTGFPNPSLTGRQCG